jgi:hypothetical protein
MYAKWDNGLMLVSEVDQSGYKPMTNTEPPPAPSGYHAVFYWQETVESFVQAWEIVQDVEDTTTDEALARYANKLTGGNAETLQEATENLIKIVKED